MKHSVGVGILALAAVSAAGALVHSQTQTPNPPPWAYGFAVPMPPGPPPAPAGRGGGAGRGAAQPNPDDLIPRKLPGTDAAFSLVQIRDGFNIADWYPDDHPTPMPDPVGHGRQPDLRACGLCHYPNGKGRPENAGVSGLPPAYFEQQLRDFRADKRKSTDYRKANTNAMTVIAKAMTEDEIKNTAAYFASIKWTQPWIKVKETDTVPKTRIQGGMFLALGAEEGGGTEPIGARIIEVPENTEMTEVMRNPRSGFIAYVPVGSIKKGEALVNGGNGKTTQCAVCHGADLKGLGPVPGLAGRSPSYTVRQMYDMQQGSRNGLWTDLMKPVVAKLTADDMLAIAAYTASKVP